MANSCMCSQSTCCLQESCEWAAGETLISSWYCWVEWDSVGVSQTRLSWNQPSKRFLKWKLWSQMSWLLQFFCLQRCTWGTCLALYSGGRRSFSERHLIVYLARWADNEMTGRPDNQVGGMFSWLRALKFSRWYTIKKPPWGVDCL